MRHAVVQRRVAIAVGHVDNVAEHCGGDGSEGPQVVLDHSCQRRLLAGDTEPLVLHRVQTGSLRGGEVEVVIGLYAAVDSSPKYYT